MSVFNVEAYCWDVTLRGDHLDAIFFNGDLIWKLEWTGRDRRETTPTRQDPDRQP